MLTSMPASTPQNKLTVSFCLNILVRVQFFATFITATKRPIPVVVVQMSEIRYNDIQDYISLTRSVYCGLIVGLSLIVHT